MQAVRLMNQGALVIDVRGKELYDAGHIGEARNVPAVELDAQADALKKWRQKTVITYCDSGRDGAMRGAHAEQARLRPRCSICRADSNAWVKDNMPLAKNPANQKQGVRNDAAGRSPCTYADWCPYCQRAKALLTEKSVAFTEIDVEADRKFREEMVRAVRGGPCRRFSSATSTSAATTNSSPSIAAANWIDYFRGMMSEVKTAAPQNDVGGMQVSLQSVYLKDCSYESPNGPRLPSNQAVGTEIPAQYEYLGGGDRGGRARGAVDGHASKPSRAMRRFIWSRSNRRACSRCPAHRIRI